jgi:hypothetical protein
LPWDDDGARDEGVLLRHQAEEFVAGEGLLVEAHLAVLHGALREQLLRAAHFARQVLHFGALQRLGLEGKEAMRTPRSCRCWTAFWQVVQWGSQ